MFVRFVVNLRDPNSNRRQGLFQAGKRLLEGIEISQSDSEYLISIRTWFDINLEKPDRLALSSRANSKEQAISWFKDNASEHIRQMREYQRIIELYGETVSVLHTERPGYIVYEDDFQVAAYPFADTPS